MKTSTIITLLLFCIGCRTLHNQRVNREKDYIIKFDPSENPFKRQLRRTSKEKLKHTNNLKIYDLTDNNINYFSAHGFIKIGESEFKSTYFSTQLAVNVGCEIGATIMLYRYDYIGSEQGNSLYSKSNCDNKQYFIQSETNVDYSGYGTSNANIISSNGYSLGNAQSNVKGSYSYKTTTIVNDPGTFSYYIVPYQNNYYYQKAVFFVLPIELQKEELKKKNELDNIEKEKSLSGKVELLMDNLCTVMTAENNGKIILSLSSTKEQRKFSCQIFENSYLEKLKNKFSSYNIEVIDCKTFLKTILLKPKN